MNVLRRLSFLLLLLTSTALLAIQGGGYGFRGFDAGPEVEEAGPSQKTEFYMSRLRYATAMGYGGYGFRRGFGGGTWSRDYPKADRQLLLAVRRLTRIDARSTEQVVDINSNELFDYPWVYAVQAQTWTFNDEQAARMREYLKRGGFLM